MKRWLSSVKTRVSHKFVRKQKFGFIPSAPDSRDIPMSLGTPPDPATLPASVDLRTTGLLPKVYNQGKIGSCTANSIGAAIEYERARQKLDVWTPSRLYIYYKEREMEGTTMQDAGAQIRDGLKCVAKGYVAETFWPYVEYQFRTTPPADVEAKAPDHKVVQYEAVTQSEDFIKAVLASGHAICFGIMVYNGLESRAVAQTGIVPLPDPTRERFFGGHAILLVGYDDQKKLYTFRNSWGEQWGDKGYGYLPYDYVHNSQLAMDFWVVKLLDK